MTTHSPLSYRWLSNEQWVSASSCLRGFSLTIFNCFEWMADPSVWVILTAFDLNFRIATRTVPSTATTTWPSTRRGVTDVPGSCPATMPTSSCSALQLCRASRADSHSILLTYYIPRIVYTHITPQVWCPKAFCKSQINNSVVLPDFAVPILLLGEDALLSYIHNLL